MHQFHMAHFQDLMNCIAKTVIFTIFIVTCVQGEKKGLLLKDLSIMKSLIYNGDTAWSIYDVSTLY